MRCQYCDHDAQHPVTACPSVKSVEFDADGNIVKVEKFDQQRTVDFQTGSVTSSGPYKVYYSYGQWEAGKNDKEEPH